MTYLIISEKDEYNIPSKYNIKETKAEADDIVNKIKATGNTKVFAIETPYAKKDLKYITVDFINKTINYNQDLENQKNEEEQNVINKKASGKQKLKDLGLDDDEIQALIGV